MKRFLLFMPLLALIVCSNAFAKKHVFYERYYQSNTCTSKYFKNPKRESRPTLDVRLRVDCMTDRYAIEYDFARKRSEAIGQSLEYAYLTGKRAGIVLIVETRKDRISLARLRRLLPHLKDKITLWKVTPDMKLVMVYNPRRQRRPTPNPKRKKKEITHVANKNKTFSSYRAREQLDWTHHPVRSWGVVRKSWISSDGQVS